jgi:hypothetical protein
MMSRRNPNARGGGGAAAIIWALSSNPWLSTFDLVDCLGMSKHAVESAVRNCIDRGLVAVDLQPRDIGQGGKRRLRCYALTPCRFVSDARRECTHLTRDQICEVLAESPWMTIQELASEKKIDLVKDRSADPSLIYMSSKLDVSDQVLIKLGAK